MPVNACHRRAGPRKGAPNIKMTGQRLVAAAVAAAVSFDQQLPSAMEGEEDEVISRHPVASPPPPLPLPPPPPSPPFPPATETDRDSQENLGFLDLPAAVAAVEGEKEEEAPSDAVSSSTSEPGTLTDDLRDKIVRQVEYYFSNENLPTDKFLLKFVKKDKEGFGLRYKSCPSYQSSMLKELGFAIAYRDIFCSSVCFKKNVKKLMSYSSKKNVKKLMSYSSKKNAKKLMSYSSKKNVKKLMSYSRNVFCVIMDIIFFASVPIAVITSFRKMKKLVQDDSLVEAALRTSSQLVVSSDGKKVKRLHPLLDTDVLDAKLSTVLVENLPEDHSIENIQRIFGKVGKIKNISIRDPRSSEESMEVSKAGKLISSKAEKLISSKLHIFVEYDTVEAAENAVRNLYLVTTLNDEKDWRSGMRVELLMKRMGKFGLAPKIRKGTEKSNHPLTADSAVEEKDKFSAQYDETPGEEQGEHVQTEKAARRGRNRGRGRSNKHHHFNGQGHVSVPGAGIDGPSKPPPGPRMPDGTRGFTMGRGKPPPSDHP
ncbi:hypothetical protein ACLOJK_008479 [Asimina triloba]